MSVSAPAGHLPSPTCAADLGAFTSLNDLIVAKDLAGVLEANGLNSMDRLFRVPGSEALSKPGLGVWRERIRLTLTGADGEVVLYLKRYNRPPRSASSAASRAATGVRSVAGVEWHWLRRLAEDGIPGPRAVALAEDLHGRREVRSAVLMTAIAGNSLEQILNGPDESDRVGDRRWLSALAKLVRKFHGLGYVHRDLYASHVFFDATRKDEEGSMALIDFQRVMRPGARSMRWIVKDLASLNYSAPAGRITQTDRLRWLESYLGTARLDGAGRRLVYRIVGKTAQIARHQARRLARIAKEGVAR